MTDDRKEILKRYETLRVADIRDGMDTILMSHVGSMSPDIRPLWRTQIVGIARTARYVPFDGKVPELSPDQYWDWVSEYYRDICPYPWVDEIESGDIIVIDQGGVDCGLMGSENTLTCLRKGALGFVTTGGVRDTDEIIMQKVPFWSPFISQSMVQGRLRYDAHNVPVTVGGVLVHPGDVIAADGDGAIVIPRDKALDVARYADEEHKRDMDNRRKHYDALGRIPDETVAK